MLLGDVTSDGRYGFLVNIDYVIVFSSCEYSFFSLFIGIYSLFLLNSKLVICFRRSRIMQLMYYIFKSISVSKFTTLVFMLFCG